MSKHTEKFKFFYQLSGLIVAVLFGAMAVTVTILAPEAKASIIKGNEIAANLIPWAIAAFGVVIYFLPVAWPKIVEGFNRWKNRNTPS